MVRAATWAVALFLLASRGTWAALAPGLSAEVLELKLETPAATAAIRGTDRELEVDRSGKTTLVVLSGSVEYFNAQGGAGATNIGGKNENEVYAVDVVRFRF